MNATPDIRLTPVDESIFNAINAGKFASRELYRLRLWSRRMMLFLQAKVQVDYMFLKNTLFHQGIERTKLP